ncbi:odorant receptor Or2-like [Dendroctonus ponderosae]|uniref:odorant receptor Or2-like n=1 Tax=Dendroctonus ponderosae TaxID=77166 RepID=UPI002034D992|nr:odorant receptor Or2-like [Dendroctonus ponderosae]
MLLEFLLNSVGLAAGIIQLVVKTTTGGFVAFLTIVILLLSQIFILSWSANEISLESSKISDAIFESNWEDYSQRIKAYFITMSMGARKPLGLTAGPFFQMSTNTAISTVKVAYTYLSLMLQNFEV